MRQYLAITSMIFGLAFVPAADAEESGSSLMERGAKLFFEGILKEVEPAVKDLQGLLEDMEPALQDFVQQMGPALADLMDEIEDFSAYHPPEILPNGDIIMRKKTPDELPPTPEDDEAVDL
jgi:hypothetical protein